MFPTPAYHPDLARAAAQGRAEDEKAKENRIHIRVPVRMCVETGLKIKTYSIVKGRRVYKAWGFCEKEAIRAVGAEHVGGNAACDGVAPEKLRFGRVVCPKGGCVEAKKQPGAVYRGGNFRVWTSNHQLNAVKRSNGIYVLVEYETGKLYVVKGKVVHDQLHD